MRAIPWIESEHPVIPIEDLNKMPSPRFFKSHNPYDMMAGGLPHTSPAKYIYVARNPKDVAVSYYYHMRMLTYFNYTGTWDEFYQLYKVSKLSLSFFFFFFNLFWFVWLLDRQAGKIVLSMNLSIYLLAQSNRTLMQSLNLIAMHTTGSGRDHGARGFRQRHIC